MRKFIAIPALAFAGALAAAPASAADMPGGGIGSYMQQWIGHVALDDRNPVGVDIREAFESNTGLKYTIHHELDADRVEGAYPDTDGWTADDLKVLYVSPRVSGPLVGLSYGTGANEASWIAGIFGTTPSCPPGLCPPPYPPIPPCGCPCPPPYPPIPPCGCPCPPPPCVWCPATGSTDLDAVRLGAVDMERLVPFEGGPAKVAVRILNSSSDESMLSSSYTLAPGVAMVESEDTLGGAGIWNEDYFSHIDFGFK